MSAKNQLLRLLDCQREVLTRLLDLIRREREDLIQNRLNELEEIIQQQATLLTAQSSLSNRINHQLRRLAAELEVSDVISLAKLADLIEDPEASQLRAYHRELTDMAETVMHEGRVNWRLTQQSLQYVDFTMKMIGMSKEGPQPYETPVAVGPARPVQLLMDSCA